MEGRPHTKRNEGRQRCKERASSVFLFFSFLTVLVAFRRLVCCCSRLDGVNVACVCAPCELRHLPGRSLAWPLDCMQPCCAPLPHSECGRLPPSFILICTENKSSCGPAMSHTCLLQRCHPHRTSSAKPLLIYSPHHSPCLMLYRHHCHQCHPPNRDPPPPSCLALVRIQIYTFTTTGISPPHEGSAICVAAIAAATFPLPLLLPLPLPSTLARFTAGCCPSLSCFSAPPRAGRGAFS